MSKFMTTTFDCHCSVFTSHHPSTAAIRADMPIDCQSYLLSTSPPATFLSSQLADNKHASFLRRIDISLCDKNLPISFRYKSEPQLDTFYHTLDAVRIVSKGSSETNLSLRTYQLNSAKSSRKDKLHPNH